MVWLIVLVGILGFGLFVFWLCYFVLAEKNLFFTFIKEGTIKIVVRGDAFEEVLIQWDKHAIDRTTGDVIEGKEKHLLGGFRFYGFWPIKDIYVYKFKWTGVTVDGVVEVHPEERLDFTLLKEDVYWCELKTVEDKDLLPLDIELLITMRIVNPYKAIFCIQNWNEMVINRSKPLFREYVAATTFSDLISRTQKAKGELYQKLNETGLLKQFEDDYGIKIKDGGIEIKDVNPSEVPGVRSLREVTLLKQIAQQEKEKTLIDADAEAGRIKKVAEGEAERIRIVWKTVQEFGHLGELIRVCEAAEKSPLAASLAIQAVPGMQEVLRGVFGKVPEMVSAQEFRELKESIERLLREKGG